MRLLYIYPVLPNIYLIAQKARVSPSTVSNIFHGREGKFSAETRERVLAIARELGYAPDARASALASHRSNNIGLVLYPNFSQISNLYYIKIIEGIVTELSKFNYRFIFATIPEKGSLPSIVQSKDADGLLICNSIPKETALKLKQLNIPCVLIPSHYEDVEMDYVDVDNVGGVRLAVDHLLSLGHRKIGIISVSGIFDFKKRTEVFLDSLGQAGIKPNKAWIKTDRDGRLWIANTLLNFGREMAQELYEQKEMPTALFCAGEDIAIGVYDFFHSKGVRIPEDISVIGFDETEASTLLSPRLTTIHTPRFEIGVNAVNLLLGRIKEPGRPTTCKTLDVNLIVRESCRRIPESERSRK